jgi:hypothetical protein
VPETLYNRPVKKDWLLVGALSLLTLASRIPSASHFLFNSDSTRMALAMEHFDVSQMRPHAPGYILYVACAKLVDSFVRDAAISLVSVSILASALTVAVLYLLSLKMYDRTNAILSSVLLATSPLFWFNGEMALTYALEGLLAVLFVYGCFQVVGGKTRWVLLSAAILGVATGVRQNMIVFFLPLWLFSLRKLPAKKILASFLVYGLVCSAWFAPLIGLSGGLRSYLETLRAQYGAVVAYPAPLLLEMAIRGKILASFMLYSFTLGIFPMLYFFGRFFRVPAIVRDIRLRFILIWILPAFIFYLGITLWNPGQVIVILPALFIFLAESLRGLAGDLEEGFRGAVGERPSKVGRRPRPALGRPLLASSAGVIVLFNIILFFFLRTPVSYAAIRAGDAHLSGLIRLTRENYAPEKTMILACRVNTQAAYYLPDYLVCCPFPLIFGQSMVPIEAQNVYFSHHGQTSPKVYWMRTGFKVQPIPIPSGVDRILVWEEEVAEYYQGGSPPLKETRRDGRDPAVYSLDVKAGDRIVYGYHQWAIGPGVF